MLTLYIGLHVKCQLFLSHFKGTCIFSADFQKNTQILKITKIRPVGDELFHVDGGQTD